MTTTSHDVLVRGDERTSWYLVREVWTSFAIGVIWAAVTVTAIFGPDLVTVNGSGTNTTTVPSAVVVALFATIATWIVARYGFRRGGDDS